MIRFLMVCVATLAIVGPGARAQSDAASSWVQIEAQPNLENGLRRAQTYARDLDDINGFALGGGWYAVLLGPYDPQQAEQVLRQYRSNGSIPRDSYIVAGSALQQRFFPPQTAVQPAAPAPVPVPQPLPVVPQPPVPVVQDVAPRVAPVILDDTPQTVAASPVGPEETTTQARQSERALTPQDRRALQTALQWAGFYTSTIDGAFGRGTRTSMAAWQTANGLTPTGVLTTRQRATLLQQYNALLEGLGLRRVSDTETGIELTLPTAVVQFDRYDPPFAQFTATAPDGPQVLLISQAGDAGTLAGLYEVMQTLEIVPLDGPRTLRRDGFELVGRNAQIISETRVQLSGGQIKGFTVVWPAGDEDRRARLIGQMQASFNRLPGVLDPAAGAAADQQIDLVAGLQIRKPRLSRSGFYVDARGTVVTTSDVVQSCSRITLDDETDATARVVDADLGIAVLTPAQPLAPPSVAQFSTTPPRLQSDVAVAGYSYEGVLDAASMTFGTLADLRGLNGESTLNRLNLTSLPGDSGGPVFDPAGGLLGMVLPRDGGQRQMPKDVTFALAGAAIMDVLAQADVAPTQAVAPQRQAPEDITARAVDMTVLVSCWE
ncbi:trypsin-like peptidase domain-containing protein [Roseobacter sp.]|uniref:trypsin-like peptidase domain-containing protein n=1 Tax=Roseobacter sp. TaxID=1907202 RepID=UPI00329746B9